MNAELITKLCDDAAFILDGARAVHKDAIQHNQFAEIIALEIVEDARKLKQKIDLFASAASREE
jgi:hypothetical protein